MFSDDVTDSDPTMNGHWLCLI